MFNSFIKIQATVFFLLCILFIPFPFHLTGFQQQLTDAVFGRAIHGIDAFFFGRGLADTKVYSDSPSMYVLVFLLFCFSIVISAIVFRTSNGNKTDKRIGAIFRAIIACYLSLMLMKYGLDKILKTQFYLPEPNTLYTPLGLIDKDLLYWSTMGTSKFYGVVTGMAEVLAAVLLFFRRTRVAGALLAVLIMLQVVAVNFGFDISVKLYSLFLLGLSLYLLAPFGRRIFLFLFGCKAVSIAGEKQGNYFRHPFMYVFSKSLVGGLILVESFLPYVQKNNFNDDKAARPFLHGAYEVKQIVAGSDTLQPHNFPIHRFFIHRNGYLVFQDQQEAMKDYSLTYDTASRILLLTDYQLKKTLVRYDYLPTDSLLILHYPIADKIYRISGRMLNWKKLPLLKKSFHWAVD